MTKVVILHAVDQLIGGALIDVLVDHPLAVECIIAILGHNLMGLGRIAHLLPALYYSQRVTTPVILGRNDVLPSGHIDVLNLKDAGKKMS